VKRGLIICWSINRVSQDQNQSGESFSWTPDVRMTLEPDLRLTYPRNLTFTEFILRRTKQFADRTALVSEATELVVFRST
jgi:hypothetical protein